jgi:hypothetical protein
MTRQALMATAAVIVGALVLFVVGKWVFYPGSMETPDMASRQEEPRARLEEPSKSPETMGSGRLLG